MHIRLSLLFMTLLSLAGASTSSAVETSEPEIVIYTEDYKPLYFPGEDGKISGTVTQLVQDVADDAGITVEMHMRPFKRGLNAVESNANHCFMALWRTQEREPNFTWVGPLEIDGYGLFALKGSSIELSTVEDSFGYSTGAVGGWTSTNYAAVACIDLPTCHGEWWPEMDFHTGFNLLHQEIGPNYLGGMLEGPGRTAIHFTHRLGALVTTLMVLLLSWQLWQARLRGLAALLSLALAAQVSLGITNVLAALPLAVAVAHNGMAALLLLCTVSVAYRLRAPAPARVRLVAKPRSKLAGPLLGNHTARTTTQVR